MLIANRAEIASRIIATAKKMKIQTVAIYSDVDANFNFVKEADESYPLNGVEAQETYLSIEKIITIAKEAEVDAIHPGYGFLAENADFAREVARNGIKFIGPSPDCLEKAGNKDLARSYAESINIPIPLGYNGENQNLDFLRNEAERIKTPLLIKAAAGGGGRGMRLVEDLNTLSDALNSAEREARNFFNNGKLILEQYIYPARHIEVQIIADEKGNIFHLLERDCSIQRRYQKVIEEAPARNLNSEIKAKLFDCSLRLAKEIGITSAATVEFLVPLDSNKYESDFYFLEINPRIQVEHPVTEMTTGLDIVQLQIQVARGEKLKLAQGKIKAKGHAIQARVCAELPLKNFQPASGQLKSLTLPSSSKELRLDGCLAKNLNITTNYDSLLLKVIAHKSTYSLARALLEKSLTNIITYEVELNTTFLRNILNSEYFLSNKIAYTKLLDENLAQFTKANHNTPLQELTNVAISAFLILNLQDSPLKTPLILNKTLRVKCSELENDVIVNLEIMKHLAFSFTRDNTQFHITAVKQDKSELKFKLNKKDFTVKVVYKTEDDYYRLVLVSEIDDISFTISTEVRAETTSDSLATNSALIISPLPGKIISLKVRAEDKVSMGEVVATIESMKMEHSILAPIEGIIDAINFKNGDLVKKDDVIASLKKN
ncbi:MAG: ATP-grasp domain-containing protein [Proteobacteria bacterium]|nr:ATP-grasp domain-containing protein [Pseudomonadota bacterium]